MALTEERKQELREIIEGCALDHIHVTMAHHDYWDDDITDEAELDFIFDELPAVEVIV
jgi:hypothetical protein